MEGVWCGCVECVRVCGVGVWSVWSVDSVSVCVCVHVCVCVCVCDGCEMFMSGTID